jgi:putative flippase GtrA
MSDDRFVRTMVALVRVLPFGLDRVVAPSLAGFAVLNLLTFSIDIGLLTTLHGGLHWPLPLAITTSYATAFALSFALNRRYNFRSHGALGGQLPVYITVVAINYVVWILGVGDGLTRLGVDYRLARVAAACCEAVYLYAALRWIVFRDASTEPGRAMKGSVGERDDSG